MQPLERNAQGVFLTLWMDGWPRSLDIEVKEYPPGKMRLFGTEQIRALHFMLGEILSADPRPDDRPMMRGKDGSDG